jgi:hypothetical protein
MRTMIVVTGVDSPQIYGSSESVKTRSQDNQTAAASESVEEADDIDYVE